MPYIPTQEDWDKIEEDKTFIDNISKDVEAAVKRLMEEHIACPALSSVISAEVDSLYDEVPSLAVMDMMTRGALTELLRQHAIIMFTFGQAVGTTGHTLHEMPCTQNGEGHLHDVEDILKQAEGNES